MMIRKLPTLLVNQIAAGEVIERPASVVKELVENSLDAGASRIDVTCEEGGVRLIRVTDDGAGIMPDQLPLAASPHATSKLENAEQLASIRTLGFRGEAVASIASVSRLSITSRAIDPATGELAQAGHRVQASGDQLGEPQPVAAPPGTSVEVRELFFNTPARRKFLRATSTELGHISDWLSRLAVVHYNVGITLTHGQRSILDLPTGQSRADRALAVLGKELAPAMLEFEHIDPPDRGGAKIWGMVSLPDAARKNGKAQHICVNGRSIRDRSLSHAIKEAFRGLMPGDRFPVAVILIDMDPALVDVNVHPTKSEVRFRNPSAVFGLVLAAVRQRLLSADLTPQLSIATSPDAAPLGDIEQGQTSLASPQTPAQSIGQAPDADLFKQPGGNGSAQPHSADHNEQARQFVDYFRRMDPTQKGFVYQQVKQALAQDAPSVLEDDTSDPQPTADPQQAWNLSRPILQVHDSYVVTQDEHGLVIVDQHALHERLMFEQLSDRLIRKKESLESQRLLMPQVVESQVDEDVLDQLAPLLEKLGIEVGPIGPGKLAIHAFPSLLFDRKVEPGPFVAELFEAVETGQIVPGSGTDLEAALHEVIDMMSCKAAVKAGDHLSGTELKELLDRRDEIERSSNCPHGRPTSLRLSLKDLAKQFGRT